MEKLRRDRPAVLDLVLFAVALLVLRKSCTPSPGMR